MMKYILSLFSLVLPSFIQAQDYDQLGNLWIFIHDKSRSMIIRGDSSYIYENLFDQRFYKEIDFGKDTLIFFESGLVSRPGEYDTQEEFQNGLIELLAAEDRRDLTRILVRRVRPPIRKLSDKEDFETFLNDNIYLKWDNSRLGFHYAYSFVSLLRPLALNWVISEATDSTFFPYREIRVAAITDDADQNDQWLSDRKAARKYWPRNQKKIDTVISRLFYNPYNLINPDGFGFLDTIYAKERPSFPKVFIDRYFTRQGKDSLPIGRDLFHVPNADSSGNITLTFNPENTLGLHLVKLESVLLNDTIVSKVMQAERQISTDQVVMHPGDTIEIDGLIHPENKLVIHGTAQLIYEDSLLGIRIKTSGFSLDYPVLTLASPIHPINLQAEAQRKQKFNRNIYLALGLFSILFISVMFLPWMRIYAPYNNKVTVRLGLFVFRVLRSRSEHHVLELVTNDFRKNLGANTLRHLFISSGKYSSDKEAVNKHIVIVSKVKLAVGHGDAYLYERGNDNTHPIDTAFIEKTKEQYNQWNHLYAIEVGPSYKIPVSRYRKQDTDREPRHRLVISSRVSFFPQNLTLVSNEDGGPLVIMKVYEPLNEDQENMIGREYIATVAKPGRVQIKPYSMKFLSHYDKELPQQKRSEREKRAIHKEYLNLPDKDTYKIKITKKGPAHFRIDFGGESPLIYQLKIST